MAAAAGTDRGAGSRRPLCRHPNRRSRTGFGARGASDPDPAFSPRPVEGFRGLRLNRVRPAVFIVRKLVETFTGVIAQDARVMTTTAKSAEATHERRTRVPDT